MAPTRRLCARQRGAKPCLASGSRVVGARRACPRRPIAGPPGPSSVGPEPRTCSSKRVSDIVRSARDRTTSARGSPSSLARSETGQRAARQWFTPHPERLHPGIATRHQRPEQGGGSDPASAADEHGRPRAPRENRAPNLPRASLARPRARATHLVLPVPQRCRGWTSSHPPGSDDTALNGARADFHPRPA